MSKDSLLTVAQAAEKKGVSRTTIYNAIANGRLATVTVLGRIAIKKSVLLTSDLGQGKSGRPFGKALSPEHRAALSASYAKRRKRRKE